jgi:hypothetical protein
MEEKLKQLVKEILHDEISYKLADGIDSTQDIEESIYKGLLLAIKIANGEDVDVKKEFEYIPPSEKNYCVFDDGK